MKNFVIFMAQFFIVFGNLIAQAPDTLWSKIHNITDDIDEGKCLRKTIDGGYIITGSCVPDGVVSYVDVLLLKTDASGNILWTKTFGRDFFLKKGFRLSRPLMKVISSEGALFCKELKSCFFCKKFKQFLHPSVLIIHQ